MCTRLILLLLLLSHMGVYVTSGASRSSSSPYKGTFIGAFNNLHHDVRGDVYAIDNITLYIENFNYDGEAPDAYFFAGNKQATPDHRGFIIPDEKGSIEVLGPYRNKDMILHFPITKKGQRSLNDVQWVSVWCRQFAIDFGHIQISKDLKIPSEQKVEGLQSNSPLLSSSSVSIADVNTIKIDDLSFDGTVHDAIFVMGSGDAKSSGSQVPDEKGSKDPLTKYSKKSISLSIPKEVRGQPIQYFGVWSASQGMLASVTFDPTALVPPSAKSLF